MKQLVASLMVACMMAAQQADFAAAWTLEQGTYYMEVYGKHYKADANFDHKGKQYDMEDGAGSYSELRFEYKLEYGLNDRLDGLLTIPYKLSEYKNDWGS